MVKDRAELTEWYQSLLLGREEPEQWGIHTLVSLDSWPIRGTCKAIRTTLARPPDPGNGANAFGDQSAASPCSSGKSSLSTSAVGCISFLGLL